MDCCSNLILFTAFSWENLLISSGFILSLRTGIDIAAPSSSQGDQSKLGGPEKSLSERSPGVGREEQPPIAVVVHSLKQVLSFIFFMFSEYEWMNVMFIYMSE